MSCNEWLSSRRRSTRERLPGVTIGFDTHGPQHRVRAFRISRSDATSPLEAFAILAINYTLQLLPTDRENLSVSVDLAEPNEHTEKPECGSGNRPRTICFLPRSSMPGNRAAFNCQSPIKAGNRYLRVALAMGLA